MLVVPLDQNDISIKFFQAYYIVIKLHAIDFFFFSLSPPASHSYWYYSAWEMELHVS